MRLDVVRRKPLVVQLLVDSLFLGLHLLYRHTSLLPVDGFSLGRDRGYAEMFQYIKELAIALLFLGLAFRRRKGIFAVFSALFLYFLIDDSFELHEKFGAFLADVANLPAVAGLRSIDLGELAVYGYFALVFSIGIGLAYVRSDAATRWLSQGVIALVAGLAFFGIVLDMLAIMAGSTRLGSLLDTVEDFGEMVMMSVITAFVLGLSRATSVPPPAESAQAEAVADRPSSSPWGGAAGQG